MITRETQIKYLEVKEQLGAVTRYALDLSASAAGRSTESWRGEYGSILFAKTVLHAVSGLRLMPNTNNPLPEEEQYWDPSSLAAIMRALIDTYFVFYYVSCDRVSVGEGEFRYRVWHYHSEKARLKKLKLIRSKSPAMIDLESKVDSMLKRAIFRSCVRA